MTPETFAKWKKTRMDKKDAELEALRKIKEAQHSAGKNAGMSGRDLVRISCPFWLSCRHTNYFRHSLNTIQSGSRMRKMGTLRMIGILQRTGGRKRMRILLPKKREFLHWHSKMRISPKVVVGARYHKAGSASPDPTVYDIFLYSMHWCLHLFHVRHYSILTTTLIN